MASSGPVGRSLEAMPRAESYPQPIACPAILGQFAYAGSFLLIVPNLRGWYGSQTTTPPIIAPFVLTFGGITQLSAALFTFRSRQWITTAIFFMAGVDSVRESC